MQNADIQTVQKSQLLRHNGFTWMRIKKNWVLYLFLVPAFLYFVIFCYIPLYGIQIAFKDFIANKGIWGSPWVGLKHFEIFFSSRWFPITFKNTIWIAFYQLAAGFPITIVFALMLNEVKNIYFKKFVQNISYIPHFISVVVITGMINIFFSRSGLVNQITSLFGAEPQIFMSKENLFDDIYVWSGIWQSMGWSSIIYFAALSGVSPDLHEAATIDGASRLQRIWHINVPAILPTIVILLIMNSGQIMNVGFENVFLLQNAQNLGASETISTYV
jgi:putative aldouronate transport system permease protein